MNQTRIGLVRCEHCGRQFNPHSGARHIPWCAKHQADSRRHKLSADKLDALERYKWRINYRPSNQIRAAHQREPPKQLSLADFARRTKKSSVNSSATLSSSSAGSTASIGTATSAHSNVVDGRHTRQQLPRGQAPVKKPPAPPPLKRSVSSHTLTRQRGVLGQRRAEGADRAEEPEARMRTKSVSDLSSMSEIVETLARRMEEIYAQNQILLANLTRFGGDQHPRNSIHQGRQVPLGSDCGGAGDVAGDTDNSENQVVCHHCKWSCSERANYCHNCGCKLRCPSESSSES